MIPRRGVRFMDLASGMKPMRAFFNHFRKFLEVAQFGRVALARVIFQVSTLARGFDFLV
jgi:hypothetical protein